MIIRKSQLFELEQQHVAQFESDLKLLLREEFPERCVDVTDEDLVVKIRSAAARGQELYGISEEDAATKFVYLTWLLGDDFDSVPEHAWIQDILRHQRPSSERMEIVMSGVIHHLENDTGELRVVEGPDVDENSET
jgi:hypothetical protein